VIDLVTRKRREKVHERDEDAKVASDIRVLRTLDELLRKVQTDLAAW
jgi:hypothetical protein